MTDRPILFSGPMVRALLAGTKTETRRVMNPQPELQMNGFYHVHNRWGGVVNVAEEDVGREAVDYLAIAVGDRLWVRESLTIKSNDQGIRWLGYAADGADVWPQTQWHKPRNSVPSIHMPRWASRLTLTVTKVRVERLQDISVTDAEAEGALVPPYPPEFAAVHAVDMFRAIWTGINGPGSWDANPWVAAYSFTVHRGNIDLLEAA